LTAGQLEAFYYGPRGVAAYATDLPRLAEVDLYLPHQPRTLTYPFDARAYVPPKQVTTARVTRVRTTAGWVDAGGDVLVQVQEPRDGLHAGQTVRAFGWLQRPAPAMNPGQFDWAAYYRGQRVLASLTVPHAANLTITDDAPPSPLQRLRIKSRALLAAGFTDAQSLDHALLQALLLGDNDPELRDVQEQFRRTGTSHHLSISGLHVAVMAGTMFLFCRLLRLRPRASAVVTTLFVLVYGLAALPSPPVWRSVLLCGAVSLGLCLRRRTDAAQLLAVVVLVMLALHPLDLYSPGFQLSFGTVLGLILFTGPALRWLDSLRDRDLMLAPDRPGPVAAAGRWADGLLVQAIAAGLVAWLVSMPVIAYHFGQLNPWAIPFGIVLAPFVFASLVGGFLKVLLTAVVPPLAPLWAAGAALPVQLMRAVLDGLAHFPLSDVALPRPPLWVIVACFAGLLVLRAWRPRAGARWTVRAGGVACYACLFLPLVQDGLTRTGGGELRVTLLAVGAGQCAVIEPPGGRTVVLDCGSTSLADVLGKAVVPFLRHRGITHVDTLVLSHGDLDHVSGAAALVRAYGVREVMTGPYFARNAADAPGVGDLLSRLDGLERPPRIAVPGDRVPLARDTTLDVLWPPPSDAPLPDNDAALIVKLTHAGRTVLFPGDVQDAGMLGALATAGDKLRSDVLIAPHHGSAESSTRSFVQAVDPRYVLSSNDRTLTNKQKRFDVIASGREMLRTNRSGAITVVIARDGTMTVEPFLGSVEDRP
ncbi:MAG TPA: ComEC/Rec2 family competence protein, partial [Tepidisphaeraceae bacterium]|nr:ComEC/Rec2 family competence protein [Tepidisphaeraceae bacterium]